MTTFGCYCPRAAAEPVLASKGEADLQELVYVSSQCRRLGLAGGCFALPLQLCSSFSPANSIPYSPARLSRFTLRAADFLLFPSPSLSRKREGFLPDSASLMDTVCLGLMFLFSLVCIALPRPWLFPSHLNLILILSFILLGEMFLVDSVTLQKKYKETCQLFHPLGLMSALGGVD